MFSFFFLSFLALFLEAYDQDQTCFLDTLANISLVIYLLLLETRLTLDVPCALEKLVMAELGEHVNVISVFYDVNSTLYTVAGIHHKTWLLLKVINIFHSVNIILFTVTNIHSIQIMTKKRNLETRWKITDDLKVKRSFFNHVIQSSQYFTLNLYVSKVTYTTLVACVLF